MAEGNAQPAEDKLMVNETELAAGEPKPDTVKYVRHLTPKAYMDKIDNLHKESLT